MSLFNRCFTYILLVKTSYLVIRKWNIGRKGVIDIHLQENSEPSDRFIGAENELELMDNAFQTKQGYFADYLLFLCSSKLPFEYY